jgi:hypothetical protein
VGGGAWKHISAIGKSGILLVKEKVKIILKVKVKFK